MECNQEPRLYFSALPNLSTLIAFRATYLDGRKLEGSQPSCCRDLLFDIPEILVSPAFDNESLFIVTEQSFSSTNEFASKLQQSQVKLQSRIEVDTELFQYCFTFTLIQKLAPSWNKVGNFFVKGSNFLRVLSKLPAITFEISVTNKICLAMMPFLVKMSPPDVDDFITDFQKLWQFKRNKSAMINGMSIQNSTCFVLPSLKRGRIHSITHQIPRHAPFKTYADMKKHWEQAYGYHLPEDSCSLYYNVGFFGDNVFSYPEWCIRHNEPLCYWRCDQEEICNSFFQDLNTQMKNLFTNPLRFTKNSLYWQKSLPNAEDGNKSCLSKVPQDTHRKLFNSNPRSDSIRIKEAFKYATMETETYSSGLALNDHKLENWQCMSASVRLTKQSSSQNSSSIRSNKQASSAKTCASAKQSFSFVSQRQEQTENNIKSRTPFNKTGSLYKFQEKVKHESNDNDIDIPDSPLFDQMVPDDMTLDKSDESRKVSSRETHNQLDNTFQSHDNIDFRTEKKVQRFKRFQSNCDKLPESFEGHTDAVVPDLNNNIKSVVTTENTMTVNIVTSEARIIPRFGKVKKQRSHNVKSVEQENILSKSTCSNLSMPYSLPSKKETKADELQVNKQISLIDAKKPLFTAKQTKMQSLGKTVTAKKHHTNMASSPTAIVRKEMTPKTTNIKPIKTPIAPVANQSQISGIDLARQIVNNLGGNSQSDNGGDVIKCTPDSTVTTKKPRSKPKIQDIDVETMARAKTLSKVNSLTLKSWLKERGIKCKASEKKEELIRKANDLLGIVQ